MVPVARPPRETWLQGPWEYRHPYDGGASTWGTTSPLRSALSVRGYEIVRPRQHLVDGINSPNLKQEP